MNKDNWKEVNGERESDKTRSKRKIWHGWETKQTRITPLSEIDEARIGKHINKSGDLEEAI